MNLEKQIKDYLDFKKNYISSRTLNLYRGVLYNFNKYIKDNTQITNYLLNDFISNNDYKKNVVTAFLKYSNIKIKSTKREKRVKKINKDILEFIESSINLSENSIKLYRNQLVAFYKSANKNKLEEFTKKDVYKYLTGSEQSKKSKLNTLKRYFNFHNIDICDEVIINIKEYKNEKTEQIRNRFLSEEELKILNKWLKKENKNKNEIMDKMMLFTSLVCGLRITELTKLKVKHIKEIDMYVRGKGNKVRYVVMSDNYINAIKKYIEENKLREDDFVFPNKYGNQFSSNGLSNRIRERFEKLKLRNDNQSTLHKLRHTYASYLDAAGVPLNFIASQLGHADINTTRIYANSNSKEKRKILNRNFTDTEINIW